MTKHKRLFIFFTLFYTISMFICYSVHAEESQDILNASSFLKMGAGARAIALGGAFVAVADDASASYWNPAGLAQLHGPVVSLANRSPALDVDYANMVFASPVWNLGTLGLNVTYYNCGDVPMYDADGIGTGTLTDREAALIASYAFRISQLHLGLSGRYVYQDMSDRYVSVESDGIGADLSALYRPHKSLTVGAVFHSNYQVTSKGDGSLSGESPLNISAGIHYKADMGKENFFSLMLDFDQTRFRPLKLHLGTELVLYDMLALRAGLDDVYAETRDADIGHIELMKNNTKPTFGLGFKWKIGAPGPDPDSYRSALIFDYALSVEKLGLMNYFTLSYQF